MPNLKKLQQQFNDSLNRHAIQKGNADFFAQLEPLGSLSNSERVNIYQHNIMGSHVNALMAIFPVVCQVVGEKLFAHWARNYSEQSNTSSEDLNAYGDQFSLYIGFEYQQRIELQDYPYLADLARLEYQWHQSYYVADNLVFNFSEFERLSAKPENLFFILSPSLSLISTSFPIFDIWKNHQEDNRVSDTPALLNNDLLCIYRHDDQPLIEKISLEIYQLLTHCSDTSLAQMIKKTEVAQALNDLPMLIEKGWITGVSDMHPKHRTVLSQ
ncbi:MAG: putative DNA-binding domain-containing protein [Thiotrichaceae bacterium]|nr:putative DNA-binding domain-containing protein [Thiotrichaceae bacterium]